MDPMTISLILSGASFLGGLGRDRTQQNTRSTTRNTFDPQSSRLRNRLVMDMNRRLTGRGAYDAAHAVTNDRLGNVAMAGRASQQGLAARLAASGIRGPAAGAAQGALSTGIFGEHVGVLNQEQPMAREFQHEDFNDAMDLVNQGRGSETTGTGTAQGPGGGVGGGFADMGQMLGWLASQGLLSGARRPGASSSGGTTGRVYDTGFEPR